MSPRSDPKTGKTLCCLRFATAQNLTQLSHLSELQLEVITRLGGHGSDLKECGHRARNGNTSTCQAPGWAALLHCIYGGSHPVTGKWGNLSQNANRMNSPHIFRKASVATMLKGRGGATR